MPTKKTPPPVKATDDELQDIAHALSELRCAIEMLENVTRVAERTLKAIEARRG